MFREFLVEHRLEELLCKPGEFHPFPYCSERERWKALSDEKKAVVLKWGETAFNGYPQLTAAQFMAYRRTGERRIFELPYFERRKILFGAVLAECIENEGRFLDAVIDGIWLICEESTWAVSAHINQEPEDMYPFRFKCLPDVDDPYVDLFAAQTASVLAYAVYFLGEQLDRIAPQITARVRREIDKRILTPFLTHNDFWWMGYGAKQVNNWNPWILSNVIDSAFIIERDGNRRNNILGRAMIILDHYIASLPEDGGCDEGAGYFNVAGASLLDCLESLYCASNGKIDFYHVPHIAAIGSYPEKAHIAGEYYLNFADCDAKPLLDGERLYTFGMRTGNERLMKLGQALFCGLCTPEQRILIQDTPQVNRTLFALFRSPEEVIPVPLPPNYMQLPDLQVYAWYRDGIYTAIKGGHNDESHNHNDVGSFLVYADGEPEIIDMGNKVYTAATFGPNRYQLNNTRSMNHNVPLIGNTEQHVGRSFASRDVEADEKGVRMDIAGAYPAEACAENVLRTLRMENASIFLQDQIKLSSAQPVKWTFMLRNKPEISASEVAFGKLKLGFNAALKTEVEEMPVDDIRMQRSFPGSLWKLTLEAEAAKEHQYTFTIVRK